MIYRLIFFMQALFILSCNAQNRQTMSNSQTDLRYPSVTRDFEKLDLRKVNPATGISVEHLADGTVEEYLKQPDGYIARIQPANSYFTLIKKFRSNGNVSAK